MAGGCVRVTYEAQAAIEMELVCRDTNASYSYDLRSKTPSLTWGDVKALPMIGSSYEIGLKPMLESIVEEVETGKSLADIGGKFHRSLAKIVGEAAQLISEKTALRKVALSGGCFQNRLLLRMTIEELRKQGLYPLLHRNVPTNDGGISLGQAAIGHFILKEIL